MGAADLGPRRGATLLRAARGDPLVKVDESLPVVAVSLIAAVRSEIAILYADIGQAQPRWRCAVLPRD